MYKCEWVCVYVCVCVHLFVVLYILFVRVCRIVYYVCAGVSFCVLSMCVCMYDKAMCCNRRNNSNHLCVCVLYVLLCVE
jgi:hypothetical protein